MIKKVFVNTGAQVVGKITTAVTTLFLTVIIGRSLGPAGYGDFVKIFTFVGYFYIFTDFGVNSAYIKLTQGQKKDTLLNTLVGLRITLAIVLAFFAIALVMVLPYNSTLGTGFSPIAKYGVLIASITILTQALTTTNNAIFQKNLRYQMTALAAVAGTLVTGALTIFVFLTKPSLQMFTTSYVLGAIATVLFGLYLSQKNFKLNLKPDFKFNQFKKLILYSWPVGIALVLNMIYFRMDVFIITYTRPPQEVGIYGLAYQFFQASLAIPIFFANALYPLLLDIYARNKNQYLQETKKWAVLLFGISLLFTIGLIFASFLIPLLFAKFQGSQYALVVLALGMPFFFISALFWHMAIIAGRQKILIPIYFIGGTVNIALNLLLVPTSGYLAAAWVTVISEALVALLLVGAMKYSHPKNQTQLAN